MTKPITDAEIAAIKAGLPGLQIMHLDAQTVARLLARLESAEEAAHNAIGFLDTPVLRREFKQNEFYHQVVASLRATKGSSQ